ncbi:MAG: glycoside hydrolase family 31 protein [Myxococcales bacterium]
MKATILTIGPRLSPAVMLLLWACGSTDSRTTESDGNGKAGDSGVGGARANGTSRISTLPGSGGVTSSISNRTSFKDATNELSASGGTLGSAPSSGTSGRFGATSAGQNAGGASERGGVNSGGATLLGGGGSSGQAGGQGGAELVCPTPNPSSGSTYTSDSSGVTFTLDPGRMRLQICNQDTIRVQYTSALSIPTKSSLSIVDGCGATRFCLSDAAGTVTITTARLKAKVKTNTGLVSFTDLADKVLVAEQSKSTTAATVEGTSSYKVATAFVSPADEALYGLGQHQDSNMNLKGKSLRLINANTQINTPVLVSNRGYGIFWDNYSSSNYASTTSSYSYSSEAGEGVDYYFFYGPSFDQVIAAYRKATGGTPLFPKWAYGLFHSKDKYTRQSEVIAVKDGYRNAKIPLDCVVQDWDYWTPNSWGSHLMDTSRYPNPVALMENLHSANVHGMISIWPVYQSMANPPNTTDQDNYNALKAINGLLAGGTSAYRFYDPFSAEARKLVYQQMYDRLLGKYGWDGVWADNTEPQDYPAGSVNMRTATTALGKGALVINAYPLQHAKALYEGWRSVGPSGKRVYVLTRSAFSGQQRYANTTWSGDIDSNFPTFARQIPAGLNYAAAGMPYWTTDIGGYWGHSVDWSTAANNELFTRWFQYGTFNPIFRVHGGGSRELYGNQWTAATKANLLKFDQLRYRLMPYLYSLAWKVTSEGYTIMRPLVFDYPSDPGVFDIKDQFLFGPSILVNPVTTAGATSRSVYLPDGTWYDFWTGSTRTGGNRSSMDAPLSHIPIWVKAGSIVPMGPMIQYATESIDPLEIRIYKGQNAAFTLYEDAGDTYDYETGQYSQIAFSWNEASQELKIGARSGTYRGMPANRTFNIVWVSTNHGSGVDVTATADQVIKYDGSSLVVSAN